MIPLLCLLFVFENTNYKHSNFYVYSNIPKGKDISKEGITFNLL